MPFEIETRRLRLISCTPAIYEAILQGHSSLAEVLDVDVPENWTEFSLQPIAYAYEQVKQLPISKNWWAYLPIHKKDNRLVGSCGFKGLPDKEGVVEIGYEIHPSYRRQGLATELTRGLMEHASRQKGVKVVQAHTLAEKNASVKVLKKCGFTFCQKTDDPDDGLIWQWQWLVDNH